MKKFTLAATLSVITALSLTAGCSMSGSIGTPPAANNTASSTPANTSANTATASSNSSSSSATPKDISGNYDVTGTNEGGGGNYKGTLEVIDHDDVYQFRWSAGKDYDGVGVQTDNAVAVSFSEGTSGKGCGVVLYKIGADGSLDGKAGYWGVNEEEEEKATRTSGTSLEGEYDTAGKTPEGKDYKGKLSVKAAGSGFAFSWDSGKLTGFGIKQGSDKVAVGMGGKQCGFVSYEVAADGTMNGKWGSVGATTVGSETATKKK